LIYYFGEELSGSPRDTSYLAKKIYCKWHDSYTHTTNECNYF
jgi:hypothetical protein